MPEHAERFLRGAEFVTWDPGAAPTPRLDPRVCRILYVAAGLEADTEITAQHARTLGIDRAADIGAFLPQWAAEEAQHAVAIRALLAGQEYDAPLAAPPEIARHRRLIARIPRQVFGRLRATGLVFCTLGAAAEYVTVVVYRELTAMIETAAARDAGDNAGEDAGTEAVVALLRGITRQERRHCAFFLTAARERACQCSPLEAGLARRVIDEMWAPPGVPSLGEPVWGEVFASFLADPLLCARVVEMDRVVDTIPHLAGMHLMEQFLAARTPRAV